MSDDPGRADRHEREGRHAASEPDMEMVDWDLAVATAKRLMRPGPEVSRSQAQEVVAQLRRFATDSTAHVREFTGLETDAGTAPVVVVDRAGWVEANVSGLRVVMQPLVTKIRSRRGDPSPMVHAVGSRVTGVEAGGLFAFLAGKVLGQFDPFYGVGGAPAGRLLLVAPNIVQVERELAVDPGDFRLWVCLHEETHRVQFTAVPWLRDYLLDQIETLVGHADLDPSRLAEMLRDVISAVGEMLRGGDVSLLDIVQTPEQRMVLDRLTAVMSLLEGHADVVMDGVGPDVVGSVGVIRDRFTARRAGATGLDQLLRKLLGLDAKLRQYRDGAAFVRGVLEKTSMADFNAVWAAPENLPTRDEIAEPGSWIRRVLG